VKVDSNHVLFIVRTATRLASQSTGVLSCAERRLVTDQCKSVLMVRRRAGAATDWRACLVWGREDALVSLPLRYEWDARRYKVSVEWN